MRKRYLLLIPLGLVVLLVAGVLVYTKVIEGDPPKRLAFSDSSTTAVAGATTTSATAGSAASSGSIDGTWKVASGSQAGYRVKEILFGATATAVGRTDAVTGQMAIQGTTVSTASFSVDLTKVTSDRSQRDGQFRGRIMNTAQFPTAQFELSKPISLQSLPADKSEITVPTTGRLTLKGKTNEVSFPLKARRNGGNIEVNGTIPVAFSDYGIDNPSAGPAQVGNDGEVEVLLVFSQSV